MTKYPETTVGKMEPFFLIARNAEIKLSKWDAGSRWLERFPETWISASLLHMKQALQHFQVKNWSIVHYQRISCSINLIAISIIISDWEQLNPGGYATSYLCLFNDT